MVSSIKPFRFIRVWVILFVFLISCFGFAQGFLKKGVVLDSIAVIETKDESFALYLPKSFETSKAYPIIFVFDPAARGRVGLTPFVESSEKHGIILVCSNNSRNGSFEKSFAVANNLFNHIFSKFKIDAGQMYLSGFSGGSRLATAIAVLSEQFAGVIACGAGFSPNLSQTPSPLTKEFLYAAICGVKDMNYAEMWANKGYLTKTNFQHTLFSFDGGHQWPDKNEVGRAIDWLFRIKQSNDNPAFQKDVITNDFLDDQHTTTLFLEANELLFAQENYERMLLSYPVAFDLESVRSKKKALVNSEPFKLAFKEFSQALEFEEKIKKKFFKRLQLDLNKKEISFSWWQKEAEKLNQLEKKGGKETARMVSRVKFAIVAAVHERGYTNPLLEKKKDYHSELIKKFRQTFYPVD